MTRTGTIPEMGSFKVSENISSLLHYYKKEDF